MPSSKGDTSNVPIVRVLCQEEIGRRSIEDRSRRGHGTDKGRDDVAKAGANHRIPIRGEDVFGARLDVLVQEDAEEEVLIKGEP